MNTNHRKHALKVLADGKEHPFADFWFEVAEFRRVHPMIFVLGALVKEKLVRRRQVKGTVYWKKIEEGYLG